MHHVDFVHLHLHSEFSLLDGAIRHDDLLRKAENLKMPAVAVTDHGNLFGAIQFYKKGFKSPVKPIIGCEVYVAPKDRRDRGAESNSDDDSSHHLILLTKNEKGYRNLCKMVSAAYTEGFYYKPRIDKALLQEHHEGLIALSACIKGEVAKKLLMDRQEEAEEAVRFYKDLFGDRYYLEIQDHGIEDQKRVNPMIINLAKKYGIKPVATNDCHYLEKEHAEAHDALLCLQTGKTLSTPNRMRFTGNEFYFKSEEEMRLLFSEIPEAITNTREVAERCNLDLHLDGYHLPEYAVPQDTTPQAYLENLVEHNLSIRLQEKEKQEGPLAPEKKLAYTERAAMELGIIKKMNFAGYFLIVWDFIEYSKSHGIPVGPGRGSAAGSLVAYSLAITDIDPLEYGLLFERFLNPDRISMPDIDIDFCVERRDEVIRYVQQKYGEKNVAQIITFGTMKARAVIRDVGRVLDMSYSEVDHIAKLVPESLKITIDEAIKTEKKLEELEKKDPKVEKLLKIGRVLEGLSRHASTHAAGVVIAPSDLTNFLPLYKPANSEKTKGANLVTQYTMTDIETLGLLKMDFLGLRNLTVIDWAEKKIRAGKNPGFSIRKIPMDDKDTYQLLTEAKTLGIFQLESSGMRDILRKLKPTTFTDVIAIVALYRPGPLGSGMIDSFINRKHGKEETKNIIPEMDEILRETYGVIVYQEQVMKLANELAGFSMAQGDYLRKAMGKKQPEIMAAQRTDFVEGCKKNGIDEKKAGELFSNIEVFGGYGFNKSHSAAYALISYQTAYLKAHYPHEFMAALLTSEMENTNKVVNYLNECREMDIHLDPPDINSSGPDFTVVGDRITFGLIAVKNVGQGAVMEIIEARDKGGSFTSIADFLKRVDMKQVNKRVLEALIKCGAFDKIYPNRAELFFSVDNILKEAGRMRDEQSVGQKNMFDSVESDEEKIKRIINKAMEWSAHERLNHEKETLGFYVSGHPLERHQADIKRLATHTISDLSELPGKLEIRLCGIISQIRTVFTKKNDKMAYMTLEDMSGFVQVLVWPKIYEQAAETLKSGEPIFLKGKIENEGNEVKIIADEIFTLREAKEKFTNAIHLTLNRVGLAEPMLDEIMKITRKYRGPSSLVLHFVYPDKKRMNVVASDRFKVLVNESFLEEMEKLLGPNSIYLS